MDALRACCPRGQGPMMGCSDPITAETHRVTSDRPFPFSGLRVLPCDSGMGAVGLDELCWIKVWRNITVGLTFLSRAQFKGIGIGWTSSSETDRASSWIGLNLGPQRDKPRPGFPGFRVRFIGKGLGPRFTGSWTRAPNRTKSYPMERRGVRLLRPRISSPPLAARP